jgi:cob(I)alamin adenosyltransferase
MARTLVRRAERAVVSLSAVEVVTGDLLRYLNRLSDHMFTLARMLNENGANDVLWAPGANLSV